MSTRVAVAGSSGRLGSLVCEVVEATPGFSLSARLTSASAPDDGADADILVDVTHPDVSPVIVERAVERGQRVLVGTSGWNSGRLERLAELVAATPAASVIVVPNFSLGSVLGTMLAALAAPHFDAVEIIETHHPAKADSPSGTAVRTAELIAEARGSAAAAPHADQPARGQTVAGVPVHSLRLAGELAKQEVRFGGQGETLSITHHTLSNSSYRAGVRAALTALLDHRGLTVGLESILGVGQ